MRPDLDARAVVAQCILEAVLHLAVVAPFLHVDEVDDDQPGQVPQLQLPGEFLGRFQVGLQRGFLDRELARRLAGVDVDGDQRLGLVDDEVAARAQRHVGAEHGVQLPLDIVAREQRLGVLELDDVPGLARREHAHEILRFLVRRLASHQDLVRVLGVEVADRALDEIAFLVDEARRGRLQRHVAHVLPQAQQILEVALEFLLGARCTRGAHDEAHAVRHLEFVRDRFQALAILRIGDLARDAAAATGVGHQHGVAAGQREVGRQRRALAARALP